MLLALRQEIIKEYIILFILGFLLFSVLLVLLSVIVFVIFRVMAAISSIEIGAVVKVLPVGIGGLFKVVWHSFKPHTLHFNIQTVLLHGLVTVHICITQPSTIIVQVLVKRMVPIGAIATQMSIIIVIVIVAARVRVCVC
jgi:hypothetical protein